MCAKKLFDVKMADMNKQPKLNTIKVNNDP